MGRAGQWGEPAWVWLPEPSTGGWDFGRDLGGQPETQLSSCANCFLPEHALPETQTLVGTEPSEGRAREPALGSQGGPISDSVKLSSFPEVERGAPVWGLLQAKGSDSGWQYSRTGAGPRCTSIGRSRARGPFCPSRVGVGDGCQSCVHRRGGGGSLCFIVINWQLEINSPHPSYPSRKACFNLRPQREPREERAVWMRPTPYHQPLAQTPQRS